MSDLALDPGIQEELARLAAEPFKPEKYGFEVDHTDYPVSWTYRPMPLLENHIFSLHYLSGEWTLSAVYRRDCGCLGETEDLYHGRIPTAEFGRQILENIGDPEEGTNFPFPQNTITPENVHDTGPVST